MGDVVGLVGREVVDLLGRAAADASVATDGTTPVTACVTGS